MTNFYQDPELSICIVGVNAKEYLRNCLKSILTSRIHVSYEIIYVDNNSLDGTVEMIKEEFHSVKLIRNNLNLGFAKANNQAMRDIKSQSILLLNPDTIVFENSIQTLVDYLTSHSETGIVGPKILNSDRSFQIQCKRGEARPWEVLCYFLGLSRIFPHHPLFSGYLQGHLDENEINNVPSISGSCMLIRKEVINQIGLLDEAFFAYQEDTDYCLRSRKAGWKVTYLPTSEVIHYGGKGGAKAQPFKTIYEWHRSYFLFYRKHLSQEYIFPVNWFFYSMMGAKLILSLIINLFRTEKFVGPKRG
jgi:hypothetical protein